MEIGQDFSSEWQENLGQNHEFPTIIRWKSGKKVDPKLVKLLELYREIYVKHREFFQKIFPGKHEDSAEVFKKIDAVVLPEKNGRMRFKTMKRSLSSGSPRPSSEDIGESELKLEKFRIRTPNLGGSGGNQTSPGSVPTSTVSK